MIEGCWLFLACWLLAQLEIQIEGAHGWAEDLPTWRWGPPWLLKATNGKPVTGYHVYLTLFLITGLHFPVVLGGFSREAEARVLSDYFLMTVLWDFQWFAWNPAWGLKRYLSETIWWWPRRLLGFPVEYFTGIAASLLVQFLLWAPGFSQCGAVLLTALILSAASAFPAVLLNRGHESA